jgi:hypothetical protein
MDGVPADERGHREVSCLWFVIVLLLVLVIEGEQIEHEHEQEHEHDYEKKLKLHEGPHRKSAHPLYFHGHGEKARAAVGNGSEPTHVLDDWNAGAEERGMNGARSVVDRIDVERIDADESDAGCDERFGQFAGEMRMTFEILIGAPMRVPAGVKENRLVFQRREVEWQAIDGALAPFSRADDHAVEIRQRFQFQLREIVAMSITMERTVDIRARVRDHLDLADLEFGSGCVLGARSFATQVIANDRHGQAFVSYHPVLDGVTEVDQLRVGGAVGHSGRLHREPTK